MSRLNIMLKSVQDVKDFVRIVNKFPFDIDLSSGRYIVDAKSIMGIFSLDMTKPIQLECHADAAQEKALREQIKQYIA